MFKFIGFFVGAALQAGFWRRVLPVVAVLCCGAAWAAVPTLPWTVPADCAASAAGVMKLATTQGQQAADAVWIEQRLIGWDGCQVSYLWREGEKAWAVVDESGISIQHFTLQEVDVLVLQQLMHAVWTPSRQLGRVEHSDEDDGSEYRLRFKRGQEVRDFRLIRPHGLDGVNALEGEDCPVIFHRPLLSELAPEEFILMQIKAMLNEMRGVGRDPALRDCIKAIDICKLLSCWPPAK